MSDFISKSIDEVVGLDLGDKHSHLCALSLKSGEVLEEAKVATTSEGLERRFSTSRPMRIALEVGTHSPWVSELLERMGHEVIVANPRRLRLIYCNSRKNDKVDALYLAKVARLDPSLLSPLRHRGRGVRVDLGLLRSRDVLIKSRTQLINHVRGVVKSIGSRLPRCSSMSFGSKRLAVEIPEAVRPALLPVLEVIDGLSTRIRDFDRQIDAMAKTSYPAAQHLMAINGVGSLTSLAYVLTIEEPERFPKSRSVGAYLGMAPGSDALGESNPQMRITKEGDAYLRRLLVNAAHYIIGPFGNDCDLRRHGLKIAARGDKSAMKRAAVAVARKLAVVMHSIWITGQVYDPFFNSEPEAATSGEANA